MVLRRRVRLTVIPSCFVSADGGLRLSVAGLSVGTTVGGGLTPFFSVAAKVGSRGVQPREATVLVEGVIGVD